MSATPDLADRYGVARPGRRRALLVVVAAVVAAFLGWLAWAVWAQATPPVDSEFEGFTVVDDGTTEAYVGVAVLPGLDFTSGDKVKADDQKIVGGASGQTAQESPCQQAFGY